MSDLTRRSLLALPLALPLVGQMTDHDQPVELNNPDPKFVFDWECFVPPGSPGNASTANQLLQHTHRLSHNIRVQSGSGQGFVKFTYKDVLEIVLEKVDGQALPVQSNAAGGAHIRVSIQQFPNLFIPAHDIFAPTALKNHPHLHHAWVFAVDRPVSNLPNVSARPSVLNATNRKLTVAYGATGVRIRQITWVNYPNPDGNPRDPRNFPTRNALPIRKGCVQLEFQPNRAKGVRNLNLQYNPIGAPEKPINCGPAV